MNARCVDVGVLGMAAGRAMGRRFRSPQLYVVHAARSAFKRDVSRTDYNNRTSARR